MQVIDFKESEAKVLEKLAMPQKSFSIDMLSLNYYGKQRMGLIVNDVLKRYDKESHAADLTASLLELSFNALKANYTHVLLIDTLPLSLRNLYLENDPNTAFSDRVFYRSYYELQKHEEILSKVKEAIKKEAEVLKILKKADDEKRPVTEEEEKIIETNLATFNRTRELNIKITMRGARFDNRVVFDIINDVPITESGLKRIAEKRKKFRSYYDEGRIADFYMENLDDTESAGFGSAMIDSRLLEWGYEPEQHFHVLNVNYKTCASITLTF